MRSLADILNTKYVYTDTQAKPTSHKQQELINAIYLKKRGEVSIPNEYTGTELLKSFKLYAERKQLPIRDVIRHSDFEAGELDLLLSKLVIRTLDQIAAFRYWMYNNGSKDGILSMVGSQCIDNLTSKLDVNLNDTEYCAEAWTAFFAEARIFFLVHTNKE